MVETRLQRKRKYKDINYSENDIIDKTDSSESRDSIEECESDSDIRSKECGESDSDSESDSESDIKSKECGESDIRSESDINEDEDEGDDKIGWDDMIEYNGLRDTKKSICEMIRSVYMGDFFETNLIDSTISSVKNMSGESASECLKKFEKLKEYYSYNKLDLVKLVSEMEPDNENKIIDILDNVYGVASYDPMSEEYYIYTKELIEKLKNYKNPGMVEKKKSIYEMTQDELREKCRNLDTTDTNKSIIYNCIEKTARDTEDSTKYKTWLDTVFKIPFGKYAKFSENDTQYSNVEVLSSVREQLDKNILYMEDTKDKILTMIPNNSITSVALHGEKGTGKSTIGRVIGNALKRPFKMISLGGESDNSVMMGHSMTYIGSKCGNIIDAIIESGCMNPVILIDELDKVDTNTTSASIYGFLTHLIDSTTNDKFTGDRYLGNLEIDLSNVMFIFTYNDASLISNILLDRMYKIKVKDYNDIEKRTIVLESILPKILVEKNINVKFTKDAIDKIIRNRGTGLRSIKHILEHIISRVKLLTILTDTTYKQVVRLKYNRLYSIYKEQLKDDNSIITITELHLNDLLENISKDDSEKFDRIKHTMYT